jgi:2,3-bisphosphoglycerate-dependent phosphoglycerate mutase
VIAFAQADIPVFFDWRLRKCDFGVLNGSPADQLRANRTKYIDQPYPGGESHRAGPYPPLHRPARSPTNLDQP